jgi:DNA-directed RNA polymerase specialized sigma24 family protein
MSRRKVLIKAGLVLLAVWVCVWGVRTFADSRKITAERVNRAIAAAHFADWSADAAAKTAAESARRDKELREIATLVNGLDFQEREKNRDNRDAENFFRKLTPTEKGLFVDLTIRESMSHFMVALDAMTPDQRKHFVEQGLKDISSGKTGDDMARTAEMDPQLLDKISQEGMKAYFEKSSTDTKLDLGPLMEAMNEAMQGLRGNEFGPRQ